MAFSINHYLTQGLGFPSYVKLKLSDSIQIHKSIYTSTYLEECLNFIIIWHGVSSLGSC